MFSSVYTIVCFMTFLHMSQSRIISSCYDTFELVSEFKEARQISRYNVDAFSSHAVDGGIDGTYKKRSCTHTLLEDSPWWYVDLGTETVISKIVIFNRDDCCADRLSGVEVRVGNSQVSPFFSNAQCALTISRMDAIARNPIEMSCNPPISGRYVTVYKQIRGYLTLCEVKVYKDIGKPKVMCPDDIVVNVDNNQTLHQVNWNPPDVSDNFHTDLSAICSPSSGSSFPVGFTKVTCSASDATGNQGNCSFVVNIADDREPDLVCPEHITVGNNTDQYEDPVTWSDPTVTDNLHKDISATCTPELGSIFDVGSTIVTCSATDDTGNVGSCSFVVHVIGQTFISYNKEPDLVCPEPIIVNNSTDQYEDPVTWKNPIVTDNLLNDISATCTPASGSIFDVGSTIVTCSATDYIGNLGSCSFVVHVIGQTFNVKNNVLDKQPVLICPENIIVNNSGIDLMRTPVTWTNPTMSSDNILPTICAPASGSGFDVGFTTVTCSAVTDDVIRCQFVVYVEQYISGYSYDEHVYTTSLNKAVIVTLCVMVVIMASALFLVVRYYKSKLNHHTIGVTKLEGDAMSWKILE
ncbi:uncharacterized protein [Antedon mediterranea]|uniref:uncharacterized protein n=1 Tax=Antedon mediterranea TaxID=105859 RepID=UPI003AF4292F